MGESMYASMTMNYDDSISVYQRNMSGGSSRKRGEGTGRGVSRPSKASLFIIINFPTNNDTYNKHKKVPPPSIVARVMRGMGGGGTALSSSAKLPVRVAHNTSYCPEPSFRYAHRWAFYSRWLIRAYDFCRLRVCLPMVSTPTS